MTTIPDQDQPDHKLVSGVADLLCQKAATHVDFFGALYEEMLRRGYSIECHQRGVMGTFVQVVHKG